MHLKVAASRFQIFSMTQELHKLNTINMEQMKTIYKHLQQKNDFPLCPHVKFLFHFSLEILHLLTKYDSFCFQNQFYTTTRVLQEPVSPTGNGKLKKCVDIQTDNKEVIPVS